MRVPDRPWAETNDGRSERFDRLADRLTRLPAGHPSSDFASDPGDDDRLDDPAAAGAHPDGPEPDDVEPDDLEPGPAVSGDSGNEARAAGFRPHRSAEPATWDVLGGKGRGPYRPWFSSDGAHDPWFAEPAEWTKP